MCVECMSSSSLLFFTKLVITPILQTVFLNLLMGGELPMARVVGHFNHNLLLHICPSSLTPQQTALPRPQPTPPLCFEYVDYSLPHAWLAHLNKMRLLLSKMKCTFSLRFSGMWRNVGELPFQMCCDAECLAYRLGVGPVML